MFNIRVKTECRSQATSINLIFPFAQSKAWIAKLSLNLVKNNLKENYVVIESKCSISNLSRCSCSFKYMSPADEPLYELQYKYND
jgi:hypothetical protein